MTTLLPKTTDPLSHLAEDVAAMNLKERRKFANHKLGVPVLPLVQAVSRITQGAPRERLLGRVNLRLMANGLGPRYRP